MCLECSVCNIWVGIKGLILSFSVDILCIKEELIKERCFEGVRKVVLILWFKVWFMLVS